MTTPAEKLAIYSNQGELSTFFTNKVGIFSILSYASGSDIFDGVTIATTALNSAITDATVEGGILLIPTTENGSTYLIDDDVTIPSNVFLWRVPGATLKGSAGTETLTINGGMSEDLYQIFDNLIIAGTPKIKDVYYEWFGVNLNTKYFNVSDSKYYTDSGFTTEYTTDDGVKIKKAHDFANISNLPIKAINGHVVITATRSIEINDNVDWGNLVIHIDESQNTTSPVFEALGEIPVNLSASEKTTLLALLEPETRQATGLESYKNYLIFAEDDTIDVVQRNGGTNQLEPLLEFFYIDTDASIRGDINYSFGDYGSTSFTTAKAYPISKRKTIIKGGNVRLNGLNTVEYGTRFIDIFKSNLKIKDQVVDLDDGVTDTSVQPRRVYYTQYAIDVVFDNIKGESFTQTGSYQFSSFYTIGLEYKNIRCPLTKDTDYWGSHQSYYSKEMKFDNVSMNRIDCHFYGCNITVINSEISHNGIQVHGFGELVIKNVKFYNCPECLVLREDYGGYWNGNIVLKDIKVFVNPGEQFGLIKYFTDKDYDFKQQSIIGKTIDIENVNLHSVDGVETYPYYILEITNADGYTGGTGANQQFIKMPEEFIVNDVKVHGRINGVRISSVSGEYIGQKNNVYDATNQIITPNANVIIDNVQLEVFNEHDGTPGTDTHFSHYRTGVATTNTSYAPHVHFQKCDGIVAGLRDCRGILTIDNSTINLISNELGGNTNEGYTRITNSVLKPDVATTSTLSKLYSTLYNHVINCHIDVPLVAGSQDKDLPNLNGVLFKSGADFLIADNVEPMGCTISTEFSTKPDADVQEYICSPYARIIDSSAGNYSPARKYGTTAQRPSSATYNLQAGYMYYDTDTTSIVTWNGAAWV
jgi:hypothetical protein